MMKWAILCAVLSVFAFIKTTIACNGYNLKLNSITTCVDNSVFKAQKGYTATLDKDCNVMFKGCIESSKTVKIAKTKYTLKKAPLPPLEGETELCEFIETVNVPQVTQILVAMGLPKKCPMSSKKMCASPDKKVNIGSFKNQLGMAAGNAEIKLDVDHGDAGKSCVLIKATISKK